MDRRIQERLEALDDENFGRLKRAGSIASAVEDAYELWSRSRNWYQRKTRWTVTVSSNDSLFDAALRWFLSGESDARPPRSVKAGLQTRRGSIDWEDALTSGPAAAPTVILYYDEHGARTIKIDGHKVIVQMHRTERAEVEGRSFRAPQSDSLHFHAGSREGQQAVVGLLSKIAVDRTRRKPALQVMTQWGDWYRRDDLPERQLDTVVLADGQMERISSDLSRFIGEEELYSRRAMPYHRGYLLHGPPGTGKTSLVRALAASFGLDLWYAPLGDVTKDTGLLTLINQVKPGSILLLEDIDVFQAARDREDDKSKDSLSMAGLLNALDGVATPNGLITFMTTNDLALIDEAVIRPGRVDMLEYIGMPGRNEIARLWEVWYEEQLDQDQIDSIQFEGSSAAVTEVLKRHIDDHAAALSVLQQARARAEERSVSHSS